MKSKVIVDPHFRRMDEIFSPEDQQRLHDLVDVIWGADERMPRDDFLRALPEAAVVVCAGWHYGDVLERAGKLRAIVDISGGFPQSLHYEEG